MQKELSKESNKEPIIIYGQEWEKEMMRRTKKELIHEIRRLKAVIEIKDIYI